MVTSAWSLDYLMDMDEDRLKRHDLSDEEGARLEPLAGPAANFALLLLAAQLIAAAAALAALYVLT